MCYNIEPNEISEAMRENRFDSPSLIRVLFWKAVNVKELIIFSLIYCLPLELNYLPALVH